MEIGQKIRSNAQWWTKRHAWLRKSWRKIINVWYLIFYKNIFSNIWKHSILLILHSYFLQVFWKTHEIAQQSSFHKLKRGGFKDLIFIRLRGRNICQGWFWKLTPPILICQLQKGRRITRSRTPAWLDQVILANFEHLEVKTDDSSNFNLIIEKGRRLLQDLVQLHGLSDDLNKFRTFGGQNRRLLQF